MGSNVYIGVRGAERWLKCPAPRTAFQPVGWSSTLQQRNGRMSGRHSRATHMEYELSWPTVSVDEGRAIGDMYYGVGGPGLIHWLDPMLENVAPAHWSFPALGATDGPVIYGGSRPTAAATAANVNGFPSLSAVFRAPDGGNAPYLYIPVPPGYRAHVGVHGVANATGVLIARPFAGETPTGTVQIVPTTAVTSTTRFSTIVNPGNGNSGVGIRLALGETINATTLASSATIASIMVQVLPSGATPTGTGYTRGGGNSGCRMFEPPLEVPISAYYKRVSISAKLTEVGA
jgi:hypothetical protein